MKKLLTILLGMCFVYAILLYSLASMSKMKYDCVHDRIVQKIMLVPESTQLSSKPQFKDNPYPERDMVPNETVAVKLALSLLESIYGSNVYKDRRFIVKLVEDSVWVVESSFDTKKIEKRTSDTSYDADEDMNAELLIVGGYGHVEISKHSGKIYSAFHTK